MPLVQWIRQNLQAQLVVSLAETLSLSESQTTKLSAKTLHAEPITIGEAIGVAITSADFDGGWQPSRKSQRWRRVAQTVVEAGARVSATTTTVSAGASVTRSSSAAVRYTAVAAASSSVVRNTSAIASAVGRVVAAEDRTRQHQRRQYRRRPTEFELAVDIAMRMDRKQDIR